MLIAIYHLELTKLAADMINAGQLKNIHELYLNAGHFGDNETRKQIWDATDDVIQFLSYKNVADLEVDEVDVNQALEHAYMLTQNLDRPWIDNYKFVKWLGSKHTRSSSVGDIFVIDGDRYVVDSCGFDRM